MLRLYRPPHASRAARWVQLIWEWEGYRSSATAERILPHGLAEISWNLRAPHTFQRGSRDARVARAALIGPSDAPYVVDTRAPAHLFGVVFQPGAMARFLGVALSEIAGAFLSLSDFPRGRELETRVGEARDAAGRVDAAVRVLSSSYEVPRAMEAARVMATYGDPATRHCSVRALRESLGLSAPTFVARVREQLGLPPAQLRQVLMFRDAVQRLALGEGPLAQVALDVGYCDQAHLARAFRRHAGMRPTDFAPPMPDHPFNVPEPPPAAVLGRAAAHFHSIQDGS